MTSRTTGTNIMTLVDILHHLITDKEHVEHPSSMAIRRAIQNESVFPEPVAAQVMTSFPVSRTRHQENDKSLMPLLVLFVAFSLIDERKVQKGDELIWALRPADPATIHKNLYYDYFFTNYFYLLISHCSKYQIKIKIKISTYSVSSSSHVIHSWRVDAWLAVLGSSSVNVCIPKKSS